MPVISALEYVTLAVESRAMGGFAFCAVDSGAIDVSGCVSAPVTGFLALLHWFWDYGFCDSQWRNGRTIIKTLNRA